MNDKEKTTDDLARTLYEAFERYDPSDSRCWNEITIREREIYRLSIKFVLLEKNEVLRFYEIPDNDMVIS